eukprot:scaffold942_cov260-Pinguiococcus_pyrenoidosus.AAC.22
METPLRNPMTSSERRRVRASTAAEATQRAQDDSEPDAAATGRAESASELASRVPKVDEPGGLRSVASNGAEYHFEHRASGVRAEHCARSRRV